jgi:hypothetical protein
MCVLFAQADTHQLGDLAPRGASDGQLNAGDLVILQRILLGDIVPTADELLIGDVSPLGLPDSQINASDLMILQRAVLGEITLGTVEIGVANPDTTPPDKIDLSAFSVNSNGINMLSISGYTGSVESSAIVEIVNITSGGTNVTNADLNGEFNLNINGNDGDILTLTVKDSSGNTSETTQYLVAAIQIVSPVSSATINDDTVNIYGSYLGGANTGIEINGKQACTRGGYFYVNNIDLVDGTNKLPIVMVRTDGIASSQIIEVNSTGGNNVTMSASDDCNISPLVANFDVQVDNIIVQNFDIDYNGDGVTDYYSGLAPDASVLTNTYSTADVYEPKVTITDTDGIAHTQELYLVTKDVAEQDAIFQGIWGGMTSALSAADKNTALTYINKDSRNLYGAVFDALMPHMTEILGDWSSMESVDFQNNIANYSVLSVVNGQVKTFIITFSKDEYGVWRIDTM